MKKVIEYSLDSIDEIVDQLDALRLTCSVFTFTGNLGAGKTTLVKRLLFRAGVTEVVTSPTFTLLAQYKNDQGQTFNHFDLYRLSSLAEFMDMGFHEYLYQPDSWSYIEWPAVILPLLTHSVCTCTIDHIAEDARRITLTF
jgi:tRNA threonylcarbamoyladenosine biosynthesis protein TsaE